MKWSYVWAFLITAAIGLWLGSDHLDLRARLGFEPKQEKQIEAAGNRALTKDDDKPFRVVVKTFSAEPRNDVISARGRTEASRSVDVRARTKGIVEKSPLREGEKVSRGDLICELDIAGRDAKLAEAKALLASAKRDYEASIKLEKNQYASTAKLATDRARAEAAQAAVEQIERDTRYTKILSPISGIIETTPAEAGSFLQIGSSCATIVDLDPIVVTAMISERVIAKIKVGMEASAALITGEKLNGKVTFISPKANLDTRTFRVEIEAQNPNKSVRDGVTAELLVPLDPIQAHKLPASALTLHDNGTVGVNVVETGNKVGFLPVKIYTFGRDHVWVGGLPDEVMIITIGQEYVLEGQVVDPVQEVAANTAENTQ